MPNLIDINKSNWELTAFYDYGFWKRLKFYLKWQIGWRINNFRYHWIRAKLAQMYKHPDNHPTSLFNEMKQWLIELM